MADPPCALEGFRTLLRRVRVLLANDRILLSQLGNVIRRLDPRFTPDSYGEARLLDLLERVPDVGVVERGSAGSEQFRFVESRRGDLASPDDADAKDDLALVRLRPDVWKAVTSFSPAPPHWSFDLDTLSFVGGDESDFAARAEQPERFLAIPDAGADFQRSLARRWAQTHGEAVEAVVGEALASDDWFPRLNEALDQRALGDEWRRFRVRNVVAKVLEWADDHGIRRDRLIVVRPPHSPSSGGPRSQASATPEDARRALHALIDALSDAEVLAFPVPAIYLSRLRR